MTSTLQRRLATATITAALAVVTSLSLGACTSTGASSPGTTPTTAGTASSAPSAAGSAAAGTEATAQICQDVISQSTAAVTPLLPLLTGATDSAALQQDVTQVKAAVSTWTAALRADAAKAQDPGVATALNAAATQIDAAVSSNLSSDSLTAPALSTAFSSILAGATGMVSSCPALASLGK